MILVFFLFADESGDITFGKGPRYFVYVGILTKSRKECEVVLSDLKKSYKKAFHRKFSHLELKSTVLNRKETIFFLDGLKSMDYEVFYVYLDTYDPNKSINKLEDGNTKKIKLLELVISGAYTVHGPLGKIIIDRGLPEPIRKSLRLKLSETFKEVPNIEAGSSHNVAGIQIADLVAGSINKHLKGDSIYYPYIEPKIKLKAEL